MWANIPDFMCKIDALAMIIAHVNVNRVGNGHCSNERHAALKLLYIGSSTARG